MKKNTYNGPLYKDIISKEYLARARKIWSSKLSDFSKTIPCKTFSTPVITSRLVIIDWTIDKIIQFAIKTQKSLKLTGNFYPNSELIDLT